MATLAVRKLIVNEFSANAVSAMLRINANAVDEPMTDSLLLKNEDWLEHRMERFIFDEGWLDDMNDHDACDLVIDQ